MSSSGIFYLDEEGDKDSSSSVSTSPRDSPTPPNPAVSPTVPQPLATPQVTAPTTLQIPQTTSPLLPQSQAFGRKSGVFAATPSFPSPLAQAITVPSQSDSSSSSHSSPQHSDDENDTEGEPPFASLAAATAKLRSDSIASKVPSSSSNSETASPSSSRRSLSRPPSPPPRQALTPGALLISRVRRSGSGSYLGASSGPSGSKSSPPRPASAQKVESHHGANRNDNWSPSHSLPGSTSGSSRGTLSETHTGGSPLAFGSPELEPATELAAPRPVSAVSPTVVSPPPPGRDSNILGLGWVPNWDGPGAASQAKGKARESWRPPSPKRELASPIPLSSAPRVRRTSEFLRPSSMDLRKQPPPSPTTGRIATSTLPTLSSSASMVSPLNPLPSPWSEVPLGQSLTSSELSSTTSPGSAAMRLNKVPTSVRLAADLIKTTQCHTPPLQQGDTPSSTATVPTPNPSPADSDRLAGVNAMRKQMLGHSVSMPPSGFNNPSLSPTQRWSTLDSADGASLSPQSSLSVSSGISTSGLGLPGSSRSTSQDMTHVWLDSSAIQQRLQPNRLSAYDGQASPPPLPATPSPVQTVSPSSLTASSSTHEVHSASRLDGNVTPGAAHPRLKAVGQRSGLAMDLAGVSATIGDAASHATMIMQSRQAKVQRWRPRNAVGPPPSFQPADSAGPSRLSASYVDGPRWGDRAFAMHHPRSGSSTLPQTAQDPIDLTGLRAIDARRKTPVGASEQVGGAAMEKQASATGYIAGIEWVDWYDCYKAYKAEKIRAETKAATRQNSDPTNLSSSPQVTSAKTDANETPHASAVELTPVTSREDLPQTNLHPSGSLSLRRRSLSIRSTISAIDHKMSPGSKRAGMLDRPRQTSGGSTRSSTTSDTQSSALRRKKNLVTKMEGWWNAVKSNFSPETHPPPQHQPTRLASSHIPRTPSAPQSRRGSDKSTGTLLDQGLSVPEPVRRASSASSRSLRNTTSNVELRNQEETASAAPTSALPLSALKGSPSLPPPPPAHFDITREQPRQILVRRGLESRRNQPSLRLDLEPASLGLAQMERLDSSIPHDHNAQSAGRGSRSSSFGSGLIPGVTRWDSTPAPLSTVTASSTTTTKDDKPVAPGADVTVASVRQHIRQRLTAAKEQCDTTLRRIVATIAAYEEERIATEVIEDQRRDYFDTFSDSPLVDAVDSEDDSNIPPIGSLSSRGPSRRGSVSMSANILSSPSRRVAMLSSVPTSPRRSMSSRRRPSIVPRVLARDIQQAARLNIDPTHSTSSSRSTSRSRSPMPHSRSLVSAQPAMEEALEADRQFLAALQELIVLATDVLETSVESLISRPTCCVEIIKKLQKTGQYWDEHEDWPGRDWYVDILMAVAGLGRVLDWWEAEKGFWKFDDDENEPLTFVMRPVKDTPQFDLEPGMSARSDHSVAASPLVLPSAVPTSAGSTLAIPSLLPLEQPSPPKEDTPSADPTAQAIEDLRTLAEQAKSINIVMELSLKGQEILYVNDAIFEVVGREPEDVLDWPITELLAPADTSHFAEATDRLLEDDGNTVELRFRFEVHDIEDTPEGREPGPVYIELEGVGMLIRENNEPSHTMWVMKPVTACEVENIEAVCPRDGNISTECVLCRICEREIVVWFFEKHNETCDAVHRLEAEISESNECLNELHQTVQKLSTDLDNMMQNPTQHQDLLFFTLPDCVASSADDPSPQAVEVRKVAADDLHSVLDILNIARQIETPTVQEDEADLPFNLQRYLSPQSEEMLIHITRWQKPVATDRVMGILFNHVEEQLRRKQKAIARMQSTIRYSEKTRHEWEDKVNQILSDAEDATGSESGSDGVESADVPCPIEAPSLAPPEQVSPGHRKIAPLARLPITQGHPQRPGPVSLASQASITTTVAPTPATQTEVPPTVTKATPTDKDIITPVPTSTPVALGLTDTPVLTNIFTALDKELPKGTQSPKPKSADRAGKGHARRISSAIREAPLSPRIPSAGLPGARAPQPSIKDFQIIKPISRGAFGSVYLAKKVATGDYYAIKALKKSDMIAKNQVTNVKAERTILMNQATSPYVVRLFFSFQSKDYLYLVMEYLNGGDCATLVKTLGSLPVDWARNYIGELVLGLEYLHARNVAHRDIKPDNLLIDARGHLKLTDFGLSKVGLLNRQIGGPRPPYLKGTALRSVAARRASSVSSTDSGLLSPEIMPVAPASSLSQSYFPQVSESGSADESSGSESMGIVPRHLRHNAQRSSTGTNSGAEAPRFVGTPDYLAPESILGGGADDRMVDWWAVGVVLYEFLYGFPPFHAETPEKVFDNVVSRRINWHEDEIDIPPEAHDLMDRLMCTNPALRLGARGADEVKQHAFFAGINWETLTVNPAVFVPDCTDPESTDYFDQRGANSAFHDDEVSPKTSRPSANLGSEPVLTPGGTELHHDESQSDDFGGFNFKNLPVLKQANDDVIRKMRSQTLAAGTQPTDIPKAFKSYKAGSRMNLPPSPSTSTSSAASTPSRATAPTTPGLHGRRPSELNALTRVKSTDDERMRRYSSPSRFRAGSSSSASASDRGSSMDLWKHPRPVAPDTVQLVQPSAGPSQSANQQSISVLIAEDNPISQKILETLLSRMGCRCVCVQDGPEALAVTGNLKFDVIFLDMHMPFVSGEQVARMIRSTTNPNQNSPIIAATAYDEAITEEGTLFSAVMGKPFSKQELMRCLSKVGFIITSKGGSEASPVVA